MDPEAYNGSVAVATMGTKLEFSTNGTEWTRVYGLSRTPDLGGEPATIDSTVLDNVDYETAVAGLQPAIQLSYEFNVMQLNKADANLRQIKTFADSKPKTVVHWKLTKASGVTITYQATVRLSYSADEQGAIEKFVMYHELKSDVKVDLPEIV